MESSLMRILQISLERMKALNTTVVELSTKFKKDGSRSLEIRKEIEINSSKLENVINRLSSDMNKYFSYVNEPDPDEISEISAAQLEAEELLCEIKLLLKEEISTKEGEEKIFTGRLPKLSLAEFDGDPLQWPQFWDQFSSNIDSRNIAEVDKLLYLKASLKGQAKQVIEGFASTNANYKIAVSTLTERYGKPTKVIDAHYSALNKIPPAGNSVEEYRRVLNDVERHLRVLNSLGENTSHSYLRFLILEKFPENLIYEMKMKLKEESVEEIRTELDQIISAREEACRATQRESKERNKYTTETLHIRDEWRHTDHRRQPQKRRYVEEQPLPRRNNYRTNSGPVNKKSRISCVFCLGNHYNDDCSQFKTLEERKSRLKDRCFRCFRLGHMIKSCQNNRILCYHCKGNHNTAICTRRNSSKSTSVKQEGSSSKGSSEVPNNSKTLHVNGTKGFTILQTAIVEAIRGKEHSTPIKCRLLLDSGSQRSYVTKSLAKRLNLETKEQSQLVIFTFGSETPQEVDSPVVQLQIKSKTGKLISIDANVVPIITNGVPHPDLDLDWAYKSNLADDGSLQDKVDILIGNDYYFSLIGTKKIEVNKNLYLIDSTLGWILSGKSHSKDEEEVAIVTYFQTNLDVKFNHPDLPLTDGGLKELWSLESIGIYDSPRESREEEAIRQFNETTQFLNSRYYVTWPWIEYPPPLPVKFGLAFGRLISMMRRLDPKTRAAYDQAIKDQKLKNIIEVVPDQRKKTPDHPIHYLPHHGVKQNKKPMRIVYDASSKVKDSRSLNECLYRGPLMLENLTGLIVKFRCHSIGISADVEKAFLQVGLQDKDRDVTRFLWLKDVQKPVTEDNLIHLRFCRVPFGVISSPFLVNATLRYHLKNSRKERIRNLVDDIYVDNLITGADSEKTAIELYKEAKAVFKEISMNLRDWTSNSKELLEKIPDHCKEQTIKILGLEWNTEESTLKIQNVRNTSKNKERDSEDNSISL